MRFRQHASARKATYPRGRYTQASQGKGLEGVWHDVTVTEDVGEKVCVARKVD